MPQPQPTAAPTAGHCPSSRRQQAANSSPACALAGPLLQARLREANERRQQEERERLEREAAERAAFDEARARAAEEERQRRQVT